MLHPHRQFRSLARCVLLAITVSTALSACEKIKPYMPVTTADKRAKLPASGITPIQAIRVNQGDTERLKTPNRVEGWLRTMFHKELTVPVGTRYTFSAASSMHYSKEQMHLLLQCKAHAFGYEQHYTSYVEEGFQHAAQPKSDYAEGALLMRYLKETGKPLLPKTDERCMTAPTEALPATAIAPVQSTVIAAPTATTH